jgi:hypothetical protein
MRAAGSMLHQQVYDRRSMPLFRDCLEGGAHGNFNLILNLVFGGSN